MKTTIPHLVQSEQEKKVRQVQMAELSLFKQAAAFFDEHSITYYALGGTLLGAVRHKGFIPWDDDMDIGIPREDYERLMVLCEDSNCPIKIESIRNNPAFTSRVARMEDLAIKLSMDLGTGLRTETVWIDIFPLDGMPSNWMKNKIHQLRILFRLAVFAMSRFDCVDKKSSRPFHEQLIIKLASYVPVQKFLNKEKEFYKLEKALKRYPYETSEYLVNALGVYRFNEMFHKKYYGKGRWYPFEDTRIWGPEDYDTVCTQLYGDYMTPPAPENRNHHNVVDIIVEGESST